MAAFLFQFSQLLLIDEQSLGGLQQVYCPTQLNLLEIGINH